MGRAADEQEARRELILSHLAAEGPCEIASIMQYLWEQLGPQTYDNQCTVVEDLNYFFITHKVELYKTGDAFDLTYTERKTRKCLQP